MSALLAGYPIELERPRIESVNSRRGLTTQIDCTDWRDTLKGTSKDISVEERFWRRVEIRSESECWPWDNPGTRGYGWFSVNNKSRGAHIFAYTSTKGDVPAGLVIDHICHDPNECAGGYACPHRRCVNPSHLVAVTPEQNNSAARAANASRRNTHCPHGHEFTPENTYTSTGGRQCVTCQRARVSRPMTDEIRARKRETARIREAKRKQALLESREVQS